MATPGRLKSKIADILDSYEIAAVAVAVGVVGVVVVVVVVAEVLGAVAAEIGVAEVHNTCWHARKTNAT